MSDDFKYKQMIEDDIDKTKISSNKNLPNFCTIYEEHIKLLNNLSLRLYFFAF